MSRLFAWFFPAVGMRWLGVLRIGIAVQLFSYAISLRNDWFDLFSEESRRISEAILSTQSGAIPRVGWLANFGAVLGVNERTTLTILWWLLIALSLFLATGLLCRAAALSAWLLYLAAVKSSAIFSYGVDGFITIVLFYLALAPLPDPWSLDWCWRDRRPRYAQLSGFFRRALQLHLCWIYFFSGLSKALGSGWWNGDNLWRALTRPPFNVLDSAFIARGKMLLPAFGIAIWIFELGYPLFIWPQRTRNFWLLAIIGMHIGIGVFMGMPLFALVMIVLNIAAFGPILEGGATHCENSSSAVKA